MLTIRCIALTFSISGVATAQELRLDRSHRPEMIDAKAERAIERGLAFLARTQQKDGGWGAQSYPTAMTSLAGLALVAGGNTPYEGKYALHVRRATDNLLRIARRNDDGLFAEPRERSHCMHGHGFAMLFLAEVYGMGVDSARQREIHRALTKAIDLTMRSQSDAGGWLYRPVKGSDEGSVTVSQVQGLRACYNAGIRVPREVIDKAGKYLEYCSNPDGGICYSARSRGSSR
ncbi:MAG: terpene cyclase/mutase family protein, partial [Pirellulales bacterium]|nr:terpene cyclase/mutase family protein [Pirellulales bacterium]